MSWTAKIIRAEKRNDKWKSAVEYSNGVDTFSKGYTLDPISEAQAAGMLRAKIAELDAFDVDVFPFPIGEVLDLTPPTPTPPVEPTPPTAAEVARQAWLDDYQLMQKYQRLIDINVIAADDAAVTVLQSSLAIDYLPVYMDFI